MSEEIAETLGSRVAALRERRGWTQKELAEKAELSVTFISEVENDKRNVSSAVLLRVANSLHASLDFLVSGVLPPARRREAETVPPELAIAAEENGWTYQETVGLLKVQGVVVARRRPAGVGENDFGEWTRQDWINLYQRLFCEEPQRTS